MEHRQIEQGAERRIGVKVEEFLETVFLGTPALRQPGQPDA